MLAMFPRTNATATAKGNLSGDCLQIRPAQQSRIVNRKARLGLAIPCSATQPLFCRMGFDKAQRRQAA
jgi:hypothetical protein